MFAFKMFRHDLKFAYGDTSKKYKIGEWMPKTKPILCISGYHVSSTFCKLYQHVRLCKENINRLYIVDCGKKRAKYSEFPHTNKVSFETIKLVKEIDISRRRLVKLSKILNMENYYDNQIELFYKILWHVFPNATMKKTIKSDIVRKFFGIRKEIFYRNTWKNA